MVKTFTGQRRHRLMNIYCIVAYLARIFIILLNTMKCVSWRRYMTCRNNKMGSLPLQRRIKVIYAINRLGSSVIYCHKPKQNRQVYLWTKLEGIYHCVKVKERISIVQNQSGSLIQFPYLREFVFRLSGTIKTK